MLLNSRNDTLHFLHWLLRCNIDEYCEYSKPTFVERAGLAVPFLYEESRLLKSGRTVNASGRLTLG